MTGASLYVRVAIWSSALVAGRLLPIVLIAQIALALCIGVLLHALVIGFTTRLYRREDILGILRAVGLRSSRQQFTFLVAVLALWYLGAAIHDHRSALNTVAIEAVFAAGVWLYLRRAVVRRELGRQVAHRFNPPRQ